MVTPNPGRADGLNLRFELPERGPIDLRVFDSAGRFIRSLTRGDYAEGVHDLTWDGADRVGRRVAPGVYFYRLETADAAATERSVVLR